MNVNTLTQFEQEELLRWFFYWMPTDKRQEMMQRYPQHYNKLADKKLMQVNIVDMENKE